MSIAYAFYVFRIVSSTFFSETQCILQNLGHVRCHEGSTAAVTSDSCYFSGNTYNVA